MLIFNKVAAMAEKLKFNKQSFNYLKDLGKKILRFIITTGKQKFTLKGTVYQLQITTYPSLICQPIKESKEQNTCRVVTYVQRHIISTEM